MPGPVGLWFPRPPPVGAHIETFRHLHLWPQKPFPTSAPTFEDFKRLEGGGMGQRGKERGVIMEESGVLGESETPSGDLLGYRDS